MFILGPRTPRFSPLSYGAAGDGVTDDLVALNAAAAAARLAGGYMSIPDGYTFAHAGYVSLRPGIKGVVGEGGVLKAVAGASTHGLLLNGKAFGETRNHRNVLIENLLYDANNLPCRAIYGHGASFCQVRGGRLFNLISGFGIIFVAEGTLSGDVPTGILIEDVQIDGDGEPDPDYYAISIAGYSNAAPYETMADRWAALHTVGAVKQARHIRVRRCRINGGYYAISLSACAASEIDGNHLTNNIRNISLQVRSDLNHVHHNDCSESVSSAVHVAYESSDNLVEHNSSVSTRAIGEGLLQSYVGSKRNVFRENTTSCPGPSIGAKYHVYFAVQSDDCVAEDNEHAGLCSHAYVAVESAWNTEVTNPAHRNYGLPPGTNANFAIAGMSGVEIRRATITGTSAVPGIFLGQIDEAASYPLSVTLDNNTIGGAALPVEEYEMTNGALEVL